MQIPQIKPSAHRAVSTGSRLMFHPANEQCFCVVENDLSKIPFDPFPTFWFQSSATLLLLIPDVGTFEQKQKDFGSRAQNHEAQQFDG